MIKTIVAAATLIILISACSEPIVSVPGGKLKGELTPVPESWAEVPDIVQVEFQPDDPYSINVWAVTTSGNLYIATRNTRWQPMIEADDRVIFKADDKRFEVRAVTVTDEAETAEILDAYVKKYNYAMDDQTTNDTVAYRLVSR